MFNRKITIRDIQGQELKVFVQQQKLDEQLFFLNEMKKNFYTLYPEYLPRQQPTTPQQQQEFVDEEVEAKRREIEAYQRQEELKERKKDKVPNLSMR